MEQSFHQSQSCLPRVVLFVETLANPGGGERLFAEEYKALKRQGVPTHVITFAPVDSKALFGVSLSEIEVLQRHNIPDGILKLRRRLIELKPEVVIIGGGLRDLYLATRGTKVRYVLHQHEPPFKWHFLNRPKLYTWLHHRSIENIRRSRLYAYADGSFAKPRSLPEMLRDELVAFIDAWAIQAAWRVTVLSAQSANEVKELYGREATVLRGGSWDWDERSDQLSHPRDVLPFPPNKKVILSVSRLYRWKRIDMIIQAFVHLLRVQPEALLAIGGVGPEEVALKNLAHELGLDNHVVFLGYVPDDLLCTYYRSCDVFVLADWTDFDITPYEALSFKRKVVCSIEMEIEPELVTSGAVFLAEPLPNAYADAMHRALSSPEPITMNIPALGWDTYVGKLLSLFSSD